MQKSWWKDFQYSGVSFSTWVTDRVGGIRRLVWKHLSVCTNIASQLVTINQWETFDKYLRNNWETFDKDLRNICKSAQTLLLNWFLHINRWKIIWQRFEKHLSRIWETRISADFLKTLQYHPTRSFLTIQQTIFLKLVNLGLEWTFVSKAFLDN